MLERWKSNSSNITEKLALSETAKEGPKLVNRHPEKTSKFLESWQLFWDKEMERQQKP
jgi:hypothetical protein